MGPKCSSRPTTRTLTGPLYMISTFEGEGSQKSRQVEEVQPILYCKSVPNADRGNGVRISQNFADFINGRPPMSVERRRRRTHYTRNNPALDAVPHDMSYSGYPLIVTPITPMECRVVKFCFAALYQEGLLKSKRAYLSSRLKVSYNICHLIDLKLPPFSQ